MDSPALAAQQSTAEALWDKILSDPPEITDSFLRSFYASTQGNRPSKSALFDDFLDAFFQIDTTQSITATEANSIVSSIQTIENDITHYRKLIEGVWPFTRASDITLWDTDRLNLLIRELKHTNCIPLLLAACKLDQRKFAEIIQLTEKLVFRYKIICNVHVTPLTNIYHRHAVAIRRDPQRYSVNTYKTDLKALEARASDSLFEAQLKQLSYNPSRGNKQIKYFLTTTEHYFRWYDEGANGYSRCLDKSAYLILAIQRLSIYTLRMPRA